MRSLVANHLRCGHDEDVEDPVDAQLLEDVDLAPVRAEVLEKALELRKLFRHVLVVTNSLSKFSCSLVLWANL